MNFLFSGLFWGIILVIFGLTVIFKAVFKIDIPVFRIIFALILIYLGIKLLTGNRVRISHSNTVVFNKARISAVKSDNEYNIIFGSGEVDLTDITLKEENFEIEVNIIFGSANVYISKDLPVVIKSSTVFADCNLPKGNSGFLGDFTYKSENYNKMAPALRLEVATVFGNANIISK